LNVNIRSHEMKALERFLTWMRGFEESVLYKDYKEHEGFTDKSFSKTVNTLWNLVKRSKNTVYRIKLEKPEAFMLMNGDFEGQGYELMKLLDKIAKQLKKQI